MAEADKTALKFMMKADKHRTGYGEPGGRARANMAGAEKISDLFRSEAGVGTNNYQGETPNSPDMNDAIEMMK